MKGLLLRICVILLFPFYAIGQNAAYFSSAGQWVNCGDVDLAGNQLTIEALIHMTGPSTNIVSKHTDPSNVNYLLRPGGFEITTSSGYSSVGNSYVLSQNVTYHVAATYDGAELKYYVNGCLTGQSGWSGSLMTNDLLTAIGNQSVCVCEQFIGYIDEVRIWNVARTQTEIQSNMISLPAPTTQPGLVAYYDLNNNYLNAQGNTGFDGTSQGSSFGNLPSPLPSALAVTASSTPVTCNGSNDATITITASGGLTPYSYSVDGVNFQLSNVFSGLAGGSYTAYVSSNSSCLVNSTVNVTEPLPVTASVTGVTNASCFATATGAASVTPSGGTLPYTYSWSTTPVQTTQTASSLAAGSYTVAVTDANGCFVTASTTITEPTPLTAVISDTVHVSCAGGNDASATAAASGGNGSYSYTWNTVPQQVTATATGLMAGTYTVTVVDGSCSASGVELITNGSFESGNTGFSSSYTYCNTSNCLFPEATYGVGSDPFFFHSGFSGADHTSGTSNLMIVNGASAANTNVWCQTIPVNPNTDYLFSTWVTSVSSGSPAQLQFSFNGINTGNIFSAPSSVGAWDQFFATWNSGTNTSVDICIVNQNTLLGGNDFGLDDISFMQCAPSCTTTASVIITEPSPVQLTATVTATSCAAANDGTASVSSSGGNVPYTYSWSTTPTSTSSSITASAGTYTVLVTDASGCSQDTSVIIQEPPELIATASVLSNVSCNGLSDGSAVVSATGGNGGFTYTWQAVPAQLNDTASTLAAGTYVVNVADSNGCSTSDTVLVREPLPLIVTATAVSDVLCFGGSDGVIQASATGGTSPYFYTWSNGAVGLLNNQAAAGLHYVLVIDSAGCFDTTSVSISEPAALQLSDSISNVSCYSTADGSVLIQVTGGTPAYSYSWSDGSTGAGLINAGPGTYSLTLTDANSCSTTMTYTITEPAPLTMVSAAFDASCNASCNGQVVAVIQGGTTPYGYSWSDPSITTAAGVNLCAGIYCITATDANGCFTTVCDTVREPAPITFASGALTAHCDKTDGSAFTSISGGTSPYTYSWSNGLAGDTASSIPGGTYVITITDQMNCIASDTIVVGNEPGVSLILQSTTNATCNDSCNGIAIVLASGGNTPYNYSWSTSPVQITDTASALCAGSYEAVVGDVNGCSDTISVIISEPDRLTVQAADPSVICIGQSATISATAAGGNGSYTYTWSPSAGLNDSTSATVQATVATTTTYTITTEDSNGCSSGPEEVVVSVHPPLFVAATADDSLCFGSQRQVSAVASGGNGGPYSYSWVSSGPVTPDDSSSAIAQPVSNTVYYVIASDGCTTLPAIDSTFLKVFPLPAVSFTPSSSSGCYPYQVMFTNSSPASATLHWDLGDGNTSSLQTVQHEYTSPGIYDIMLKVTDFNGCTDSLKVFGAVEVFDHPVADFVFEPEAITILDPLVHFSDNSSGLITQWNWSVDTVQFSSHSLTTYVFPDTGSYPVSLFVTDENGCTDDTTLIIYVNEDHAFYLPNAFSPNGDGINDKFGPQGIGISNEDYLFEIYDRWGNLAFRSNDPSKGWDGKSGGVPVQDIYVWRVKVKNAITREVKNYRGTVTIVN